MRRMMFGDEANLAGCLARSVHDEVGDDRTELGERVGQRQPGLIVADKADEDALRSQRREVARDITGTADRDRIVLDRKDRSGASGEMRDTSP